MEPNGVVAAGHRLTAETGADALRAGGTAFDAAIAALAMACVCEPVLCSPGGGGFAMVRDGATGETSVIDFFPHTPLRRNPTAHTVSEVFADFGTATQAFHIGPATSATPGLFHGVEALHRAGASTSLADLVAPAAQAARDGVAVTPFQHHLSTVVEPILTATDGVADLFAPAGHLVPIGEPLRNAGLADALEVLAAEGFADSDVGRASVALQFDRGHITSADVGSYSAVTRTPLSIELAGATVHLNPLPAAGGALIGHCLSQLASFDPLSMARALEATDAARRRAAGGLEALSQLPMRQRGTTHISVIDRHGTACAITVSNGEGNGELVDGFGFMLNNVLGEEDVNPFGTSDWPADTRLSSMMCPTIIEAPDGGLMALGSGGSNRIRSAIGQVVARLCLDDPELRGAVDAPRLHVENDHLDLEDHYEERIRAELLAAFPIHRAWPRPDLFFGGVHAVRRRPDGTLDGVGDARRDGAAVIVP